jgi:uncharacterized LabA/DUF88 family protein
MSDRSNKLATFIDGANLHATTNTLGFDIDYKRLLQEFRSRGTLVRAFYFTMLTEDQEFASIRPLIDWLDYNGYTVITKPAKEYVDAAGHRKLKGDIGVELAVQVMELAQYIDQLILFSWRWCFPFVGGSTAASRHPRKCSFHDGLSAPGGRR